MISTINVIVYVQAATMVLLGIFFAQEGEWRMAIAQALLAAVTCVIYTGRGLG